LTGQALSSLDRPVSARRGAPEPHTDPDIDVAESTVQVVEEVERNAGASEEKPPLAKEKRVQLSIHGHHAEESGHVRLRAKHLPDAAHRPRCDDDVNV
jgi:hypothetical protein